MKPIRQLVVGMIVFALLFVVVWGRVAVTGIVTAIRRAWNLNL